MTEEVWMTVAGFDRYQVSTLGRVSGATGRLLNGMVTDEGYRKVRLYGPGGRKDFTDKLVHHLVLETFVGPRPDGHQCRHLNGVEGDNRLRNLAWGTAVENMADVTAHGHQYNLNKTHCPQGHPYSADNLRINRRGTPWRQCKTCHRDRERARRLGEKV